MTYLEHAKLVRDTTKDAWLHRALCKLVELAEGYRIVKDDDRCECDEDGEGPCVWCQMKEAVEELDQEARHEFTGKNLQVKALKYWCCRADYPNHEPGCKNAVKGP